MHLVTYLLIFNTKQLDKFSAKNISHNKYIYTTKRLLKYEEFIILL